MTKCSWKYVFGLFIGLLFMSAAGEAFATEGANAATEKKSKLLSEPQNSATRKIRTLLTKSNKTVPMPKRKLKTKKKKYLTLM